MNSLDFRKVLRTIPVPVLECTSENMFWFLGTSKLARAFGARFIRSVSGFLTFPFFIVPLPKILASRPQWQIQELTCI